MKIYNEQVALQSKKRREVLNLTTLVKAAVEKSGCREGIALVSSPHSNTAIVITEDAPRIFEDLEKWLEEVAPAYRGHTREGNFEGPFAGHFSSLLLNHQVVVPISEAHADFGPGQVVLFVELDGLHPRRVTIKILGE